jgi:hypothetical protein
MWPQTLRRLDRQASFRFFCTAKELISRQSPANYPALLNYSALLKASSSGRAPVKVPQPACLGACRELSVGCERIPAAVNKNGLLNETGRFGPGKSRQNHLHQVDSSATAPEQVDCIVCADWEAVLLLLTPASPRFFRNWVYQISSAVLHASASGGRRQRSEGNQPNAAKQ